MLVLTFKVGERLALFDGEERIGTVVVLDRRHARVKLGFEGIERIGFWRESLLTTSQKEDDHAEGAKEI